MTDESDEDEPKAICARCFSRSRGIAVFYGATAPSVALAEIRPPVGSRVVLGRFEVIRPLYAEALRRGGAIVTAKVPDDEERKYAAILDRSAIDMTRRAAEYRSQGWSGFDPSAPPYNTNQVGRERELYRL